MQETIRRILLSHKDMRVECQVLQEYFDRTPMPANNEKHRRLKELERTLSLVDKWLLLLSEDEHFVVQRHLLDEIDWFRIAIEYRCKWGEGYGKAERTLKRYQKSALSKIERFMVGQKDILDFPSV